MLRSLASFLLAAVLLSMGFAQDLLFSRSVPGEQFQDDGLPQAFAMPAADGGYVLYKDGSSRDGSVLSRYTRDGIQLASVSFVSPFGEGVSFPVTVVVDAQKNIYLAYRAKEFIRSRVYLEKFSPTLTRLGRITPVSTGFVGQPRMVTDGTNVYLGFVDGTTLRILRAGSNFAINWQTTLDDVTGLASIAVNNSKLLLGLGAGGTPFLAGLASATGAFVVTENLPNNGEFSTDNAVHAMAFASNGDAFGITQTGGSNVATQLFRLSASNVLTNGPVDVGSTPVAVVVTPVGICYTMNQVSTFSTRRVNPTTLASEAFSSLAQGAVKTQYDPAQNRLMTLAASDSTNPNSFAVDQDPLTLAGSLIDLNNRVTDFTGLGLGRSVLLSDGLPGFRQQGFQRFVSDKLWDYSELDIVPAEQSIAQTVVDSQNNLYALVQGSLSLNLLKISPTGTVLFNEVLLQQREGSDVTGSLAMGPDDRPVVFYGIRDFVYLTKFRPDGSRIFDRSEFSVRASRLKVAVAPDNAIFTGRTNSFEALTIRQRLSGIDGSVVWSFTDSNFFVDLDVTPLGQTILVSSDGVGATIRTANANGSIHESRVVGTLFLLDAKLAIQPNGLVAVGMLFTDVLNAHRFVVQRFDPVRRQILMNSTLIGSTTRPSFAIATSAAGTIYLAQVGTSRGLVQYNSSGAISFVKTLPSGVTRVIALTTDAQNSVYVLAEEEFPVAQGGTAKGWLFVKYNTLGTLISQRRFQSPTAGLDGSPATIAMGRVFDIWVGGNMQAPSQPAAPTVLRYLQPVAPTVQGETYQISVNQTFTDPAPGLLRNDSDLNGDSLTVQLVSNPAEGSVTLSPNGSFTFTAGPTQDITVNFKYRVIDSTGRSTIGQCNLQQIP
jgi:hypothetical protein